MADSKLINLTQAFSDDLTTIGSLMFFAILDDDTPVQLPAAELIKTCGTAQRGVLYEKTVDQTITNGAGATIIEMNSIVYDPDAWLDANSPNILRCPNDESAGYYHMFYQGDYNGPLAGDNAQRKTWVQYTSVSSTKYSSWAPLAGVGSMSPQIDTDLRMGNSGNQSACCEFTNPIYVESGDQFQFVSLVTGANTDFLQGHFGFAPFKIRT